MIEIFPDTPIKLSDLIIILFGIDGGQDQQVHHIFANWFKDGAYTKELGKDSWFDASPGLESCEISIIMDGIYDIKFECGLWDIDDIAEIGWGKFTIQNNKVDRFLFEEY